MEKNETEEGALTERSESQPDMTCHSSEEPLETVLEALLFVSTGPIPAARLATAVSRDEADVKQALERLGSQYAESRRAFELVEIARGYQILTRPAFHGAIQVFKSARSLDKLSASALETLAIVAYKQPLIRADIEAIRGVQCGPVLRGLLDRRLVRVAGRDKRPGSPILYRTTNRFLEHFGLKSLKELPSVEELKAPAE